MAVIFASLTSTLERAISALEKDINTLDVSSGHLEHSLPWFTGVVALGVLMELWVIRHERREGVAAWKRGIVRPPDRPSIAMYLFEIASVLLITGGIVGELWIGVKVTAINGRSAQQECGKCERIPTSLLDYCTTKHPNWKKMRED